MTTKERIIRHLDTLDEARLTALEKDLGIVERDLEKEFRLLDELAAPMGEEERTAFNGAVRRRPLFGGRRLEPGPDDA